MQPTSPQHDPRATADAETFAAEFLAREEQGLAPTLDVYIAGLPPEHRDDCRERIITATRARGVLRELGRGPSEPSHEPPTLKGFRIERLIGRGGVGAVYAAWDETLERPVAIKVLRRGAAVDVRERVIREARKAAGIQDAGIVTVYSVIDEGEEPAIVMELVEGHPIDRAAAALGFRDKARLLQAVARALSVAHERGVIHRDLKPENVLVTPDLRPKVVDFGLAVDVGEEEGPGRFFKGTPLYASPEQTAARSLTPASDVFSFGSLMFTVLTGKPPFQGAMVEEVFERIAACEPPFPRTISSDIPEDLQAVCLACLTKEPQDRPSAADVAADIGRYLVGEPVRSRPSLYRDILRRRISSHSSELGDWECQGMISSQEKDRLDFVYRRILADEDHWIVDARRFTPAQTILYTGSWVTVVAAALLVWLIRDDLAGPVRWLGPLLASAVLLAVGFFAQARRDSVASGAFLAGAVLSIVPTALACFGELAVLADRPQGVTQLLAPPFSNHQALTASLAGLALSLLALWRLPMTGFAWTTAALTTTSYVSLLCIFNWLGREPEVQALWCLPLVVLEAAALLCEQRGRVRWAMPFHLVALLALVACLDVIAFKGPTLTLLGLDGDPASAAGAGLLGTERAQAFSLALNGLLFIALMALTGRARSLDLRRGSHLLGFLGSVHVLWPLYKNAQARNAGVWVDVTVYLGSVLFLLVLGPLSGRRQFLISGLAGVALGSHMLLDLGLVPRAPFVLGLGAAGLAAALGTYGYLAWKARAGGGRG